MDGKVQVDVAGFLLRPGVWLGKGAEVDPTARIDGPAIIGGNAHVGAGHPPAARTAVLGQNTQIGDNVTITRSVVHENSFLGAGVSIDGTVLGRSCDLRQGVHCEEGVVLGEECFVGAGAVITSDVKVYPFKTVEAGAIVNTSIVWESRGARSLFGRTGVTGLANVDISPELVMRLSMAWAGTLEKGSTITASRDTSRAARVLKRAVMVGCNAAGVNVDDLEAATVPVTRHQVRSASSIGGVTVRLASARRPVGEHPFLRPGGASTSTRRPRRRIERLYHREEFRRALAPDIGDIGFPGRALEHYTSALVDSLDAGPVGVSAIAGAGFKLVLDYSFGTTSFVMPNVLAKLGAEVLVVNPYASTAAVMASDRSAAAKHVADLVTASGAHLGAVLDPGGELVVLVDDEGRVLTDDEALLVLLDLGDRDRGARRAGLPAGRGPEGVESVSAASNGVEIVWTKLSPAHLMEASATPGVVFGGEPERRVHLPFVPAGVRRCRNSRASSGDAREVGRPVVEADRRPAGDPHGSPVGRHPVGPEGCDHAHPRRAVLAARPDSGRRGEDSRGRRMGARAAGSGRAAHPCLGGGADRARPHLRGCSSRPRGSAR